MRAHEAASPCKGGSSSCSSLAGEMAGASDQQPAQCQARHVLSRRRRQLERIADRIGAIFAAEPAMPIELRIVRAIFDCAAQGGDNKAAHRVDETKALRLRLS